MKTKSKTKTTPKTSTSRQHCALLVEGRPVTVWVALGGKDTAKPTLESSFRTIRLRPYLSQQEVVDAFIGCVIATVNMVECHPVEGDGVV